MTEDRTDGDRVALDLLIRGFQVSRMLRLAADLGIADKIPKEGSWGPLVFSAITGGTRSEHWRGGVMVDR